jgi:hypothetical protein
VSDRDWLRDFVNEASHNPTRLLRTIAVAGKAELSAAAAVVDMVENAEVKVFGYAALARRDPRQREKFLAQAAAEAKVLDDPVARAGVLLALVDVLPEGEAVYFSHMLEQEIPDLVGDERRHFEKLFRKRALIAEKTEKAEPIFKFEFPATQESHVDLDLEEIAGQIAYIQNQKAKKVVHKIRPIGRAFGRGKVRLNEIGRSLHIDPQTFEIGKISIPAAIEEAFAVPGGAEKIATERPERVVNTGFADEHGEILHIVAEPSTTYRYFIDIGDRLEEAPDSEYRLPEDLGPGTIDVVMFTNDDGLTLEGPERGKFRIEESGKVTVLEPAATVGGEWPTRMFFAFHTPETKGACSMRCSFYSRGSLIQSRSIVIPVGMGGEPTITPDYILSRTLSPRYLAQIEPPRLSMMLNANADGTHTLRFYGDGRPFGNGSTFGEGELTDRIKVARAGLRLAAWGTESDWDEKKDKYRFRIPQSVAFMLPDLYELARRGHSMWATTITKLAGGRKEADDLAKLMERHGSVHLALKENASHILPIALFYDYAFTRGIPKEQQKLCPSFLNSLAADDLADEPCFVGNCPSRTRGDTICPSGFWGYRHAIGLPPSIGAQQSSPAEIPPFILTTEEAAVTAGVSTDPKMSSRIAHVRRLKEITGVPVDVHDTCADTVAALAASRAPVVYFYCHGGLDPIDGAFIQVGPTDDRQYIAYADVRAVQWEKPRPIVFINGCHTTAVSPEQAFNLVQAFVSESSASGVIGTEITIFESLATSFAEAFFKEFVVKKRSAGEAIRRARLSLLHSWRNPLGLVYIPFVLPDLHLRLWEL